MQVLQARLIWLSILVAGILFGTRLQEAWQWNSWDILFLKQSEPIDVQTPGCDHIWLVERWPAEHGDPSSRRQAWGRILDCSPRHISLLHGLMPYNIDTARFAAQRYPNQARAWFWLAEAQLRDSPEQAIKSYWRGLRVQPHNRDAWVRMGQAMSSLDPGLALSIYDELQIEQLDTSDPWLQAEAHFILASALSKSQPDRAIDLYRQGLRYVPHDGVRWHELGALLSGTDPQAAVEAYLQSCYHGDPGNHGCYDAGLMMERLGDPQRAITYYRLSHWQGALDRARELEAQLVLQK